MRSACRLIGDELVIDETAILESALKIHDVALSDDVVVYNCENAINDFSLGVGCASKL